MPLINRIVLPAMGTNLAGKDGCITAEFIDHYMAFARGGTGLIITENISIHPSGRVTEKTASLHMGKYIPGFEKLARRVHRTKAKIAVQLNHAGRQTSSAVTGRKIVGPSPLPCPIMKEKPRPLTEEEIDGLSDCFAEAAGYVREAGCDAVEFHMAHGYLICQFLSPYSNQRLDRYGGNTENRARFAVEILQKSRHRVGPEFPLICRISADEIIAGGLKLDETQEIAKLLVQAGASAIHVSAANYASYQYNIPSYYLEENCFIYLAEGIKRVVEVPVIAVGRILDPLNAEKILESRKADLIAMGRALLADPFVPQKASTGQYSSIRPCLSCNQCYENFSQGNPLQCVINPEKTYSTPRKPKSPPIPKKIFVVGGGPAGLEAARTAKRDGHEVILFEKKGYLGGQIYETSILPGKHRYRNLIEFYHDCLTSLGVEIITHTECNLDRIEREKPDIVVIASGAKPYAEGFIPRKEKRIYSYDEIFHNHPELGKKILVLGGGSIGAEITDYLANQGKNVTVIEKRKKIGLGLPSAIRFHLEKRLMEREVSILCRTEVLSLEKDSVKIISARKETELRGYDSIILALGRKSRDELSPKWRNEDILYRVIGDAKEPRQIQDAISEGANIFEALI